MLNALQVIKLARCVAALSVMSYVVADLPTRLGR